MAKCPMSVDAPKSPPGVGRGYPLKASALDAALNEAEIRTVPVVRYLKGSVRNPTEPMPMVQADYGGLGGDRWSPAMPGQIALTAWSVPSSEQHAAKKSLETEGLPSLCAWIHRAENEAKTWRSANHRLTLTLEDGRIVDREED